MIYLFSGDDTKSKIKSYEAFLKKFNLPIYTINRNNYSNALIENFYSGASLFDPKSVIILNNILENTEYSEFIFSNLEFIQKSENTFIFNENKLLKTVLDKFNKIKAEVNIFELKKEQKEKFNNFLLADAFAVKDKMSLWLYYRQAVDLGVGLEELSGVLFWKIKDMILKKNFLKYKEEDLKNINFKLAHLLAKARREGKNDEIVFEKFILEVV
ncbi:MAG: hypothetical protein KBD14_00285 [Candidatus Pacebacteria bacterium]|nr:hypothetical protein [Candidatus Paceibacterota bacterium]